MIVLIDNISPTSPGFTASISRTFEQQPCSYQYLFTDFSTNNNVLFDNVEIEFYVDSKLIGLIKQGQTVLYDFTEVGNKVIRQFYTIYTEHPQNKEILYKAYEDFTITVQEWQPFFSFSDSVADYKRRDIEITPSLIELNNNVCPMEFVGNAGYDVSFTGELNKYDGNFYANYNINNQALTYKLYKYDNSLSLFTLIPTATKMLMVASSEPDNYRFTYSTSELGVYKLIGEVQNCCKTATDEIIFSNIDTLRIIRNCKDIIECEDCKGYTVFNDTMQNITVRVYDQIRNRELYSFEVLSLGNYPVQFTEDGVYRFNWIDDNSVEENAIVVNMCDIDKCYTNLIKAMLCREKTKGCCDDSFLNSRLATIQALYQTFTSLIEPYLNLERRYSSVDITKYLQDFLEIDEIIKQLLEFCDVCKRGCSGCFSWNSGNCI